MKASTDGQPPRNHSWLTPMLLSFFKFNSFDLQEPAVNVPRAQKLHWRVKVWPPTQSQPWSFFTDMISFQQSHVPEIDGKDYVKEEKQARKHLNKWLAWVHGVPVSSRGVGPCNFEVILSLKGCDNQGRNVWKKVNITPVFKKGKKDFNFSLCKDGWVKNPGKSVPDTGSQVSWRRSFGVVSIKGKSCLSWTENLQEDWVGKVFCRMRDRAEILHILRLVRFWHCHPQQPH